jgi:two-component system NtrC family sensor kinase
MTARPAKIRFSFQFKVLVPVLAALVLLPTITLWIVNDSISDQVQAEAKQSLTTAEAVFRQSIDFRARDLLTRFNSAVKEPSYRSIAPLVGSNDPLARDTVRKFLLGRLEAYGDEYDAMLVAASDGAPLAVTREGTGGEVEGWTAAAGPFARAAVQGESAQGTLEFHGRAYLVVAVPIPSVNSSAPAGALAVATRLSEAVLQDLKALTNADIVVLAGSTVTASTIRQSAAPAGIAATGRHILPVVVSGEHYYALADDFRRSGSPTGFRYILLSSYEQRLRELEHTRTTLLGVSIAGILLSGVVVWLLIRRITHPLEELRDNAEAVGRGDFTRRIAKFSNDECGAVAVAFNEMTANLQASRADLEQAVGSLKTAQAQLVQSEKLSAIGQFVAGVAHELNNPLTTVIGFADLLQHTLNDPKHQSHVDHIAKAATRCHKIVNNLLSFSRQHEPERVSLQLNKLTEDVVEILAYDLRTSNITLVKEYAPALPPILGDSHQLQQVILNVINNARQALEAFRHDGCITLRTGATASHVWLRIIDNGPGISRENLSRIFDPFFTTKPQGKGTGLGLSLCYGIMQEHRGRIRAESQPGAGTEFILELPIAAAGAGQPAIRPDSAVPFKTPSLRVLVVDDEDAIRHLVEEVLLADGHQVESASSGTTALDLILKNRYDVIVSDWKMPGLNGINLYQELLVKDPPAASRMLFMTGDVIKQSFQEFLKHNARVCLPKPFALREFRSAIAGIVDHGENGRG